MNTSRSNDLYKLFPQRTSEDGKKLCRKCGKELSGRRTSWCSDECKFEALTICYPSFARDAVWRRDKGVCAKCGVDAAKLQRAVYRMTQRLRKAKKFKLAEAWVKRWRDRGWPIDQYNSRSWWDADHIQPVVEGGGGCGLDNYRTLCVPCHKAETAELARRRAKARQKQVEFDFAAA